MTNALVANNKPFNFHRFFAENVQLPGTLLYYHCCSKFLFLMYDNNRIFAAKS